MANIGSIFMHLGAGTALALAVAGSAIAQDGGRPLETNLTGAAEVPGPGDPDGAGTAKITVNQGKGQVCFELTVSNIDAATMAHIHAGAAKVAGNVVVVLTAPANGSSSGCVDVSRDVAKALIQNPAGYYVNVHNEAFPAGAIRGQLGK